MNIPIGRWKKGIGFFLALACAIVLMPVQTAQAAPAANPLTLRVEQDFTQPAGASADDQILYTLKAKTNSSPMPAGSAGGIYTFTVSGTGHIDLPTISFPAYGTYTYEIAQATAAKSGYTYDSEIYTVTVYYEASYMERITTNRAGQKVPEIQFSHTYAPQPSNPKLMTYPPVKLTVEGNPGRADTFSFMLTEQGATGVQTLENPMPEGSTNGIKTVSIKSSGEASFGAWSYEKAGIYYYKVTQIDTGLKGYTYDLSVYTITDTVKDINGQLVLDRIVTNSAGKAVQACIYINKYTGAAAGGKAPDNGNGPNENNGFQTGKGPKTGDDTNPFVLRMKLTLSCLTAIGCAVYLINDKRRKKNAEAGYRIQNE